MDSLIERIREALTGNIDEKTRENSKRFFKEEIKCYGVKVPKCNRIANQFWSEVKILKKEEIFKLCEILLASDYCEESYIVSAWLPKLSSRFEKGDWGVFKKWIELYINNWAKCDSFCNHTIGDFLLKFPEFVTDLKEWTLSANRWVKRAASVSLIIPARKGYFLPDIFEICDRLLLDQDDMVQKGYGWLLKATSEAYQKEVFDYILKNKEKMPRTALRYAIEKMPEQMRKEAMEK
ncbi:MAG TPA: DNA alkylation repair protein [Atribacterota bacterium]|nr:DNA alkylation repair protein [Atribacterota bacterium]